MDWTGLFIAFAFGWVLRGLFRDLMETAKANRRRTAAPLERPQ